MGKTRISLQTAAELIDKFRNGVFFIDLTFITNSSDFYSLILSTLSIKESGGKSEFELLKGYLIDKDILLILDNFEHIMDAAVYVSKLLAECHGIKVLVTSREAIHIRGECVYRLPPLKIPVFDRSKIPTIKKLTQYDSVRLFIERALEVTENFKINNTNAPAVAEICVRLDGIPLAIELAAARITALSPQALLKRLGHRLAILTFGAADLPDRQQTLRTTIDWSFDLLDKNMQDLFMSLSVFVGGFDIEAAEAVYKQSTPGSVLDGIEHLLEKSLLIKTDLPGGEPWFHMLETIHEYASEQLKNSDLHTTVKERYAEYFLELSEEGEIGIQSPKQKFWMDKFSHNHENLISVLKYFEMNDEIEKLAQMAGALGYFWQYKGLFSEGIFWYRRILNIELKKQILEDKINIGLGILLRESGQHKASRKVLVNVLDSKTSNNRNRTLMKFELAWTIYRLNDFEASEEVFNTVLQWAEEQRDEPLKAKCQFGIGAIYWRRDDFKKAEQYYLTALVVQKAIGDPSSIAQIINNLGLLYAQTGDLDRADNSFCQSLVLFKKVGDFANMRITLNNLGNLNFERQKYKVSIKYYNELIRLVEHTGDSLFLSTALSGIAVANIKLGKIELALGYAKNAYEISSTFVSSCEYGISLRILGDIWRYKNNYKKSKEFYEKSILNLKRNKETEELTMALNSLELLSNE